MLAIEFGDVQAGLLSALVIISLFLAIRQQITSSWRDRAEVAEQSLSDVRHSASELHQKIAQLEALPNLTEIKQAVDLHDARSVEAWTANVEALHELRNELQRLSADRSKE